jgi:flagellar protein FliS
MMPVANPWKSYRQISTQTAPPGQLVLMLFDGALNSIDRALLGFNVMEIGERNTTIHNNLTRAIDIIRELNHSLDTESGGQLADTLRNLYVYFERRLVESNLKKSRKGVDEIIPMLKQLRDAWSGMLTRQTSDTSQFAAIADSWPANQYRTS